MNLIPVSALTRYGLSIGAALEMPILFYALSLRGSRRREAQVRAAALAHNDALTGLAHTRTLLQRLESALGAAAELKHASALMAVKISNFESIAAEFGRETADKALVVTASLLRRAITDIDLAARVGEHEFALLLEGPTTHGECDQPRPAGDRQRVAVLRCLAAGHHAQVPHRGRPAAGQGPGFAGHHEVADRWRECDQPPDARKLIRPLNF